MPNSSVYYFENGLRKVNPYYFTYITNVKSRWIGKTVYDIFTEELGQEADIIEAEISKKLIYVESDKGKKCGTTVIEGLDQLNERKIQSHDLIYNSKHVHEPSVPQGEPATGNSQSQRRTDVQIIFENHELLVVNKPSGVPTHPKSNFRYNSVTEILKHDLDLENVWPCHRLDKVTSGVLILGISKESGRKYLDIISTKRDQISKQYVARVRGKFPREEFIINCPIFLLNISGGYIMPTSARNIPGNSTTIFKRLIYNEELNESVVLCKPITGRMHQIRIHLRNIGHPIVNDYEYNPINITSKRQPINKLKNQIELELYNEVFQKYPCFTKHHQEIPNAISDIDILTLSGFENVELQKQILNLRDIRLACIDSMKNQYNKTCKTCQRKLFDSDTDTSELEIWLHALRYEYTAPESENSFCYETDMPSWSNI